jgi:putative oxidoreductase
MYPDLALLLLRVAIGGVIIPHGLLKLGLVGTGGSIVGVAGWFNSLALRPGVFWAYVAVLAEAGGGLLTLLGLGGPIGPGVVAGDLIVVLIVAHWSQGFWAGRRRSGGPRGAFDASAEGCAVLARWNEIPSVDSAVS